MRRMEEEVNKEFISTAELAAILGISRVAVFKNIDNKKIPATRVGRAFVVSKKDVPKILRSRASRKHSQKTSSPSRRD
jgi:excisionase family DNA binding protein